MKTFFFVLILISILHSNIFSSKILGMTVDLDNESYFDNEITDLYQKISTDMTTRNAEKIIRNIAFSISHFKRTNGFCDMVSFFDKKITSDSIYIWKIALPHSKPFFHLKLLLCENEKCFAYDMKSADWLYESKIEYKKLTVYCLKKILMTYMRERFL